MVAIDMGADGYLVKPFESEEFLRLVASFVKD
jgi:DNA-binding response OmpR family regulator